MFIAMHIGRSKIGVSRAHKSPYYYKLTKSRKARLYAIFHSGKYTTTKIGLVLSVYK